MTTSSFFFFFFKEYVVENKCIREAILKESESNKRLILSSTLDPKRHSMLSIFKNLETFYLAHFTDKEELI